MTQFLVRRLILVIPVLFGILFVTFALARILPGDVCYRSGGKSHGGAVRCIQNEEGLDDPIPIQFVRYLGDVLHGDFGNSLKDGRPVTDIVLQRLPMTIEITIGAMLFATFLVSCWASILLSGTIQRRMWAR